MDAATIQAKIYAGRGKAAIRLGFDYVVYRPNQAIDPLTNQITTLKAAFNAGDNDYRKPNLYGKPIWFGDFDANQTQVGDYLVHSTSPTDRKFIAGMQQLLPIVCIDCNRSVRVSRQATSASVGAVDYSGTTAANEVNILGSASVLWPASVLFGSRSQAALNLPAGAKQTGWRILLPASVPAVINASDIITDDLGRRYVVDGAELTDLGYRINVNELHT